VEYYGLEEESSSRRAQVRPRRSLLRIIKFDHLGQASQYVDLSPERSSSREGFHGSSYVHNYETGTTYYGAIISVYSAAGELFYQGATKPQLCERATANCRHLAVMRAEEEERTLDAACDAAKKARSRDRDDPAAKAAYEEAREAYRAARSRLKELRAAGKEME